jgi:Xaa-Pro aminopeptidase
MSETTLGTVSRPAIADLQARIRAEGWDAFVVPSTDEYLSEFTQAFARRLTWLTGFTGSMGTAIVLRDAVALFVDGRYTLQARQQSGPHGVEIVEIPATDPLEWLATRIGTGARLAVDTRLQSYRDVERTIAAAREHRIEVVELGENPIDDLWQGRPSAPRSRVIDYPEHYAGLSAAAKLTRVRARLAETGTDVHLVSDPEDVGWLLNVRTRFDDELYLPVPLSRVLVPANGPALWFVEGERLEPDLLARIAGAVEVRDPSTFEDVLRERAVGRAISADARTTPHRFAAIADRAGSLRDDPFVGRARWIKHPEEIARFREGYERDGFAVIRLLAWLTREVAAGTRVTELDVAARLEGLRREDPAYRGPSMPYLSASGPSSAMPHYAPTPESNRTLGDHPIYLLDSGAQYHGCSTDNTVTFALGAPEPKHVLAHTLVVKGVIGLTEARFPDGVPSTSIDAFGREHLWRYGMDFKTGLGHGVGNFSNIHEGPYIRKEIDNWRVAPVHADMIFANEPGYYADGDFGIRVETHMLTVRTEDEGFLTSETLSLLPIDPTLLDPALLDAAERRWLVDYHDRIAATYAGRFDPDTDAWLTALVAAHRALLPSVD